MTEPLDPLPPMPEVELIEVHRDWLEFTLELLRTASAITMAVALIIIANALT